MMMTNKLIFTFIQFFPVSQSKHLIISPKPFPNLIYHLPSPPTKLQTISKHHFISNNKSYCKHLNDKSFPSITDHFHYSFQCRIADSSHFSKPAQNRCVKGLNINIGTKCILYFAGHKKTKESQEITKKIIV